MTSSKPGQPQGQGGEKRTPKSAAKLLDVVPASTRHQILKQHVAQRLLSRRDVVDGLLRRLASAQMPLHHVTRIVEQDKGLPFRHRCQPLPQAQPLSRDCLTAPTRLRQMAGIGGPAEWGLSA